MAFGPRRPAARGFRSALATPPTERGTNELVRACALRAYWGLSAVRLIGKKILGTRSARDDAWTRKSGPGVPLERDVVRVIRRESVVPKHQMVAGGNPNSQLMVGPLVGKVRPPFPGHMGKLGMLSGDLM